MKNTKHLILTIVAVFLVTATILGTVAYLTSTKKVTNTFTVGDVAITLDEEDVDINGVPTGAGRTTDGNTYKLIPGQTYTKDPTVTVKADSEDCYVRMVVVFNNYSKMDALRADYDAIDWFDIDLDNWAYDFARGLVVDTATDTASAVFYYKEMVKADDADQVLEPLFTKFTIPGDLAKELLYDFGGTNVTVEAHAIQAAGFANHMKAWEAFDAE